MPGYYRKVIKIKAEQSPNVRRAMKMVEQGLQPDDLIVIPGVLTWKEYQKRRMVWDKVRQSVGLDAEFWLGSEVLLYPPDWLNRAEALARLLRGYKRFGEFGTRQALGAGCDPAEGGDKTSLAIVDQYGLMELTAWHTTDTSEIVGRIIDVIRRHSLPPHQVMFDRGGGGKQLADQLRRQGYNVRTVAFGEAVTGEVARKGSVDSYDARVNKREERYAYKNRRAEMYGDLRLLLDPSNPVDILKTLRIPSGKSYAPETTTRVVGDWEGYAIPARYHELRRQLSLMPLKYDEEGRMYMLSKGKRYAGRGRSLIDVIGNSPDEADSFVLAIHAMLHPGSSMLVGAMKNGNRTGSNRRALMRMFDR